MTTTSVVNFDPWNWETADDPYPAFEMLRRQAPVHFVAQRGYWTVARYDDVYRCMRNTDTFSSDMMYGKQPVLAPTIEELERDWEPQPEYLVVASDAPPASEVKYFQDLLPAIFEMDPPQHNRLRRLLVRPLRPKSTDALESEIRTACDELFDGLAAQVRENGMALFKSTYARPLALRITSKLIGVPQKHAPYLGRLAEATLGYFALEPDHRREFETAYPELCGYFEDHLAKHGYQPPEPGEISMINPLRAPNEGGDEPLSAVELISNAAALFRGGFETTVNLMSNTMVALLDNPDQLAQLNDDLSLAGAAAEEGMRYDSPVLGVFRVTTRETQVAGTTIPEGAMVQLLFGSANRDEAHFQAPAQFRITRPDVADQLAFGHGRHFCLGAPLARMEATIAFQTLLSRVRDLRLAAPAPVYRHAVLRGRKEVPITFELP
jgi:cytochrome P450